MTKILIKALAIAGSCYANLSDPSLRGGHFSVILYSIGRMRVIDSGQGSDGLETSSKWFLGNFSRGAPGFELKNIDLGPKNIKKLHEKCHFNAIQNR